MSLIKRSYKLLEALLRRDRYADYLGLPTYKVPKGCGTDVMCSGGDSAYGVRPISRKNHPYFHAKVKL